MPNETDAPLSLSESATEAPPEAASSPPPAAAPGGALASCAVKENHGGSVGRVDRAASVIRNVKILGRHSTNVHPGSGKPYRYTDSALVGFAKLQEGSRVYVDHLKNPTDGLSEDRGYAAQLGELRNVSARLTGNAQGTYGDFHYNPAHPLAEKVVHDAEHNPHLLAMSHVATGQGRANGDYHDIETAESVASVDVVSRGGTNATLFESAPPAPSAESIELAETKARLAAIEADLAHAKRKDDRRAALAESGVEASEDVLSALTRASDEDAKTLIEALRASASAPVSRGASAPASGSRAIQTTADFISAISEDA